VGHLPRRAAAPKKVQAGKATGPTGTAGLRSQVLQEPDCHGFTKEAIRFFNGNGVSTVRSTIINKIMSFQYRLGKLVGRRKAGSICSFVERTFTNIFGREVYDGGK
jgi:hypothetical protein